ncbi:hypothetical protein Y032_0213g2279 [Ancylostoma ceylanicum]|uniref:GH18 domain-containing protein n=1 Tax=Ancylostoma ceylanicum TaxID=53326 RepID=A0A016SKF0_9BILA|nr:hypothetical protein Y032_0213g2279 [Ancylostoma ceylanicum]
MHQTNIGLCVTLLGIEYFPLIGKVELSKSIDVEIFSVSASATIKTNDLFYPEMCARSEFECEDYCIMRDKGWDNGQAYGTLKGCLFSFGSFDGLCDSVNINYPSRAGCNVGQEAAVLIFNERTCKNPTIDRKCWSGDDEEEWEAQLDMHAFAFVPYWATLFVCRFMDPNGQMIGFDVYGGKSGKRGKKNFYYAIRNDGIYFGEKRGEENELIESWDTPCIDASVENMALKASSVPTGTSSVPAAACGKRVVGYYTGWGTREITEDQIRRLTHVIFAFVATQADGSIGFGAVSNEPDQGDAAAKAMQRFNDLRSKVRTAKSGTKMLFAVGGWENSQYFSSIAADPTKRANFVNHVANFLRDQQIDGVDVDWEYPVTGGATEGIPADKQNYVTLLSDLRTRLTNLATELGRTVPYEITLASAAGEWTIRPGYDLSGIMQYADFINVMTYDYYGAWGSQWGAYTGPPSPLFYGSPPGFSGKLNADFTMKYYSCRSGKPSKLNMGVPFYGRYWENVGAAIDANDEMWRTADAVGGVYQGGYLAWKDIPTKGWSRDSASFHEKTKAPYIYDSGSRRFLGFENVQSLQHKVNYAIERNLGGLMIWAIDLDDYSNTLLDVISSADLCSGGSGDTSSYQCVPIDDIRWWTPENSGPDTQIKVSEVYGHSVRILLISTVFAKGQCGKSAPLINGYYPVCDPDDPGYSCCGPAGYCGSGSEYCTCEMCVDYRTNPQKILDPPTQPTRPIQWYTMNAPEGQRGRCGSSVPTINGQIAICNPDDPFKHCCSNGGYCGTGAEYCECNGCVDYKTQ